MSSQAELAMLVNGVLAGVGTIYVVTSSTTATLTGAAAAVMVGALASFARRPRRSERE